ncbi:MAG: hypothetical protein Q8R02_20340 [Hyphomonadaceae bacterium]|nr:hypothetical protein [Hyphomonadaceae bacterium]
MTALPESDAAHRETANAPGDPGARLLLRVGDFVEPLTRFDRSHLSMAESRHDVISVMMRQTYRAVFEVGRSEGFGALPEGVAEVADAAALARESEAQLAASRTALAAKLTAWAAEHGEDPLAKPTVADCFVQLPPLGFVDLCKTCNATGLLICSNCKGAKEFTCETCNGRGALDCQTCEMTGEITCNTCKGMGTVITQKEKKHRNQVTGQTQVEHYQDSQPCAMCGQSGKVKCPMCSGYKEVTCRTCEGRKMIVCAHCEGMGTEKCAACDGHGKRHYAVSLTCSIRETFDTTTRTSDAEIAATLKARGGIEGILQLASSHRATAEANNDTLARDTMASIPVTSIAIGVGEGTAAIRGYGERQDVLDYRNIAAMLLKADMDRLDVAGAGTTLFPPKVTDELHAALSDVLASEANVAIAMAGAKADADETAREFRGAIAADYVKRAGAAVRKGLGRAYWAALARGPAAVLALPLLFAPVDLLMRGAGGGARIAMLIAFMVATFGVAVIGHVLIVRKLQAKLAPAGSPRIRPIIDRLGLTAAWLITAGAVATMLSLIVAGLVSSLFPSG